VSSGRQVRIVGQGLDILGVSVMTEEVPQQSLALSPWNDQDSKFQVEDVHRATLV